VFPHFLLLFIDVFVLVVVGLLKPLIFIYLGLLLEWGLLDLVIHSTLSLVLLTLQLVLLDVELLIHHALELVNELVDGYGTWHGAAGVLEHDVEGVF